MEFEPLRTVSRSLFGHRYRLELLAALADAGEQGVCLTDVAASNGTNPSVFYPPIRELQRLGMVARRDVRGHRRRVLYAATEHGAWPDVDRLVQSVISLTAAAGGSP